MGAYPDIAPIPRCRHFRGGITNRAKPLGMRLQPRTAKAPNPLLLAAYMAKTLSRSLLAVLLAASTLPPAASAADPQQQADDAASSDTLHQFKKATVAIGKPTEGAPAFAGRDAMEIVSSGFLYAYTPVEFAPRQVEAG